MNKSTKDIAKHLQELYITDKSEFVNIVQDKIRFAWCIKGSEHGKAQYDYEKLFDGDFFVIIADPKDVMSNSENGIESFSVSKKGHIPVGQDIESRIFTIAVHCLQDRWLDAPYIYVTKKGVVKFSDGRHRTSLAIDCDINPVPFIIRADGLENLEASKSFKYTISQE